MGAHQGAERPHAADGALGRQQRLRAMFINRTLFKAAGIADAPKTMDDFTADAKKISAMPGKYGYCLRGGPGGLNGWVMFGAGMNGDNTFFKQDGTSTFTDPGWVQG